MRCRYAKKSYPYLRALTKRFAFGTLVYAVWEERTRRKKEKRGGEGIGEEEGRE